MCKKILVVLVGIILNIAVFADTQLLDKVVAVVNDQVVTQQQWNQAIQMLKMQYQEANQPLPDDATLKKNALDGLIAQSLQLQVAKKNKVTVSDAQVNQAIVGIAQRNNMSVDQLKQMVQKQGMTYSDYQKQIQKQMTLSKLQQQVVGGLDTVTEAQITKFLQQQKATASGNQAYHVEDVLLAVKDDAAESTWKERGELANQLYAQLQQKVDINTLKSRFPDLSTQDLGWRELSGFPDIFAPVVKGMTVHTFSKPVRTGNGYHILYLAEIKSAGQTMTREQAKQALFQMQAQEVLEKWVASLRAQSYIKITD